jgi:hypothetical protein
MEEVTAADRDIDSIPPRDSIDAHDASDSTQNGDSIEIDSATVIKDEDQLAPVNGAPDKAAETRRCHTASLSITRRIAALEVFRG